MKHFWGPLLIVFLFSNFAVAQDNSASPSDAASTKLPIIPQSNSEPAVAVDQYFDANLLDTLHYRVPKGHAFLAARFGTSLNDATNNNYQSVSGNTNTTSDAKSWSDVNVDANYGISDNFLVGFSDTGTLLTDAQQSGGGSATNYAYSGWSDPNLLASYRFLGGLTNDRFASIGFTLSPSAGTAIGSVSNASGNELRGDTMVSLGVNGYAVQGRSEFSGSAGFNYHTSGAFQYADGTGAQTWSPFTTYDISGNYRFHFHTKYFIGVSAVFNLPHQVSVARNDGSLQWVNSDGANLSPTLQVGWKVSENLLAKLDYNYSADSYSTAYSDSSQASGGGAEQYLHLTLDSQF